MTWRLLAWRQAKSGDVRRCNQADDQLVPEFRTARVGYLEWSTPLAMQNCQPAADVVALALVPRWAAASPRPPKALKPGGPEYFRGAVVASKAWPGGSA